MRVTIAAVARRGSDEDDEFVDLRAPEHAWWAARQTDPFATPRPDGGGVDHHDRAEPDPYRVLRVAQHASWDDIVTSYRRLVRWWHPDGLVDATATDVEACELRIRELNAAYRQLRVRRGR